MLFLCAVQFQTDLGRENSVSCYRQATRQLLLTFLTMFLPETHPIASSRFLLSTITEGVITTRSNRMKFRLTIFTRWSRSTSTFYALIGQNLTGEFMQKI